MQDQDERQDDEEKLETNQIVNQIDG